MTGNLNAATDEFASDVPQQDLGSREARSECMAPPDALAEFDDALPEFDLSEFGFDVLQTIPELMARTIPPRGEEAVQIAIRAGVPEPMARQSIHFAIGDSALDKYPVSFCRPFAEVFCIYLAPHKVGHKDGKYLLQCSLAHPNHDKDGKRVRVSERKKINAKHGGLIGGDIEGGDGSTASALAKIKAIGLPNVTYSTHSHLRPNSGVLQTHLIKHLKAEGTNLAGDNTPELIAQCREYLQTVKGYDDVVFEDCEVAVRKTRPANGGFEYVVTHRPMARMRVIFVFDGEGFNYETRNAILEDSLNEWTQRLRGFFTRLGAPFDESCLDPTRLFYLPRHNAGAPHFTLVMGGK